LHDFYFGHSELARNLAEFLSIDIPCKAQDDDSFLTYFRAGRNVSFDREHNGLAIFAVRRKDHPLAFKAHHHARIKIRDDNNLLTDKILRRVRFRDAGKYLARFSDIDRQFQKLFGTFHALGRKNFADPQIHLLEFINGHWNIIAKYMKNSKTIGLFYRMSRRENSFLILSKITKLSYVL